MCYNIGMKTLVTLKIEPELKEKLKDYADKERRSLSNVVILAIEEYLKNKSS